MATATQPKTTPTIETSIKTAVRNWAKAENSAIWTLINTVYEGLQGVYGPDRDTRSGALKAWINQSIEEAFGEGEAAKRAAHVSKVMSIGLNATPAHFEKWKKEGTGFYKAAAEFAIPQQNPKKKAETVKVPAGQSKSDIAQQQTGVAVEPDESGSADAKTGAAKGNGEKQSIRAAAAQAPAEAAADPTPAWATRIQTNAELWRNLCNHLTEKKETIITPIHVLDLFNAISKKEALFRTCVEMILQMEQSRKILADAVRNEPDLFKEVVAVVLAQNVAKAK
jgi:hypothetical protein